VRVAGAGAARADFQLAEQAAVVAPVVVSASREVQRPREASATIDVLDGAEVRLARAAHPAQLLKRLPGVYVSQLSGRGALDGDPAARSPRSPCTCTSRTGSRRGDRLLQPQRAPTR
jgi:outer membrane receptor for Fe3+-dicitrate